MIAYHPVPLLDRFSGEPKEPKTIGQCVHCEFDIEAGEEYVKTKVGRVHDDCFRAFAWAVLEAEFGE